MSLNSAMPGRPWKEFAQGPEPDHQVTLNGSSHDDPDAEEQVDQSDDNDELAPKKKRTHHILKYEVVKRWVTVTGDKAEKDDDDIQVELEN